MNNPWPVYRRSICLALFCLPVVLTSRAVASPLFTWSFVNPSGFVQPEASIPVDIAITNTGSSVIQTVSGTGIDDTFTNSAYGFRFNGALFGQFLNLQPGQTSGLLQLGTYTPISAPVPSETYSILLDQFTNLSLADSSGGFTEAPSNGFQRTVRPGPEFTWSFLPPAGSFGTGASIPVDYTITNTGDTTITSLSGMSEDDTFTPFPYSFQFSPTNFLTQPALAPGQASAPLSFGTFTPIDSIPPGSYSILNDQFTNITLGDTTGSNTIQTSNSFTAVVTATPEPAAFTMVPPALVALALRRVFRRP